MNHVLIKIPSRERPNELREVLDAVFALKSSYGDTTVLVSADDDDTTMADFTYSHPITVMYGERTTKVGAINRDLGRMSWDIVLVLSDDMIPVVKNFDTIVRAEMLLASEDLDACLWLDDGKQTRIPTIACMGRKYWGDHGRCVYDPRFRSYCCDDAQLLLADREGKMRRVDGPFAVHHHSMHNNWMFMGRKPDALLSHNQKDKGTDREMLKLWKKENGF